MGILLLLAIPGTVSAVLITVQEGENLQLAIDGAAPGDTLRVEGGTYAGNFMVTSSLTLQGTGMPVLDGKNTLNRDTITLLADGIHLEGFVITGSARAGVNISSDRNVIRGNQVVDNEQFGIAVWGAGNQIEENTCNRTVGTIRNGIGIYLSHADGTRVINNTLLSQGKNGIQISSSSSLLLEGNHISVIGGRSGGGHGIRVDNSPFLLARGNRISDCLTDGLYLYNASHSIFRNLILDNTSTGIMLWGTDNTTFDFLTVQNQRVGMDISSSGILLSDRVFRSFFSANTEPIRVTGSVMIWNSPDPQPYAFGGQYFENFTGNYWDTCLTTDGDGDGIGDIPCLLLLENMDAYPLIASPASYDWNPDPPDVTPPGPVIHLTGDSPDPYTYTWTWEDPGDADLDHLVLSLDGTYLMNLPAGVEALTLDTLAPSTAYTLGILTVDMTGNLNPKEVNHTGTTLSLPDPPPSPTETSTPVPSLAETTTPTITIPTETATTTPPSTAGTGRRNTRYFPPPSPTHPPLPTSLPATPEEVYPSALPLPEGTVSASETTGAAVGDCSPWAAGVSPPTVAVLLVAAGAIGYLFLRKKR